MWPWFERRREPKGAWQSWKNSSLWWNTFLSLMQKDAEQNFIIQSVRMGGGNSFRGWMGSSLRKNNDSFTLNSFFEYLKWNIPNLSFFKANFSLSYDPFVILKLKSGRNSRKTFTSSFIESSKLRMLKLLWYLKTYWKRNLFYDFSGHAFSRPVREVSSFELETLPRKEADEKIFSQNNKKVLAKIIFQY